MKVAMLALCGFLFSLSVMAAWPIVDLPKIAGSSKDEVSEQLGKPTSCGDSKYGEKCTFEKAKVEIVFINGKADWITIEAMDNVALDSSALTALGLKPKEFSFADENVMRWDSIPGFIEISIFPVWVNGKRAPGVDYAYIKTSTR